MAKRRSGGGEGGVGDIATVQEKCRSNLPGGAGESEHTSGLYWSFEGGAGELERPFSVGVN